MGESRADAYYHFLFGTMLLDRGEITRGEQELLLAAKLAASSPTIASELSSFYLNDGRTGEALIWGRKAVAVGPEDALAHRALGEALATSSQRSGGSGPDAEVLALAIVEVEAAVRLGGDDAETLVALGRMQSQAGLDAGAVATFERLIARWGDSIPAHLLLAKSLVRAGRNADAVTHYQWILDRSPSQIEALSNIADSLEELERWDEAAVAWGRMAELRRGDSTSRMKQGLDLLRAGKAESAIEPLLAGRALDPDNSAIARLLAMALSRGGRRDEAIQMYRVLIAAHPAEISLLAEAAWALVEGGRGDEALPLQEKAVELAAKNPASRTSLAGNLALDLARMRLSVGGENASAGALEALEKARSYGGIDPLESELLTCRARFAGKDPAAAVADCRAGRLDHPGEGQFAVLESESLIRAGRGEEGKRLLDELARSTTDPDLILFASGVYERAGDRPRAIALLGEAADRFPESDVVRLQYGAMLEADGQRDEAKAQMRRAIDLNSANHVALNYLGYMLAEAGENLDEAQTLIERALSIEPTSGAYLDSLGWVLFRRGRAGEALEPLTRAARLLDRDSTVREHLGDVLSALGRREEAESEWRQALLLGGPAERIKPKLHSERAEGRP